MKRSNVTLTRRAMLAGGLATLAAGCASTRQYQSASTKSAPRSEFDDYDGVYALSEDHPLGINRFVTDAGTSVLLFADYRSGVVRPLAMAGRDEFTMGPTFDTPSPVEQTVRFVRGRDGHIEALTLQRVDPSASVLRATRIACRDEAIEFESGDAQLAGALNLPPGKGPHPAVVLLHGSGPLGRHSFGPYPRFFNSLGFAVLRFDKRGVGASTGRRLDASTGTPQTLWRAKYPDDLVADALSAHALLRARSDIDARCIGFWGSSEGGMVATQAAAQSRHVAFAINSSGFMGPLWQTILYQGAAMMRAAGSSEDEIEQAVAFNRFWMEVARTGRGYAEFLQRRDAIIRSGKKGWLFYVNAAFTSLEQMQWTWERILSYDSLPALRDVNCPVLGLFGADDVLTDARAASQAMRTALASGGNRDVTVQVLANASHSLMETPGRRGMAPGVFDTLRKWLTAHGRCS